MVARIEGPFQNRSRNFVAKRNGTKYLNKFPPPFFV